MKDKFAKMTKTSYELKEGTKTVYVETEKQYSFIDETEYNNIVDSSPFFRRLGGSETATKNYTCRGYKVVQLVSKSPDRQRKIVRTFDFSWKE